MPYTEGRVVHDADSHIFEPPGTAERHADPAIRARLAEALRHISWSSAVQAAVAQQRDAAFRARDPDEIMLRKNQLAPGAVLAEDRPAALDLLGFASQLVFTTTYLEPLRTFELGARQLHRREGVRHFGDALDRKWLAGGHAKPRLNLRRIRLRFSGLRFALGRGDSNQLAVGVDAAAALHRRRHDAARDFGGDLRVFLRSQRAAHPDKALDRLLDGGNGRHVHRRGVGRAALGAGTGAAATRSPEGGAEHEDKKTRQRRHSLKIHDD